MKAIRENIVGLIRFIGLLCSMFIAVIRPKLTNDSDKYRAILGHDSEPLAPTETIFCPKCHVGAGQVRRTKQGTEIIQNGKVPITVGSNVIIEDGKKMRGFPISCPNGHTVRI